MTYNDLKREVAALGFDTDVENGDAMLFATRRAISTLFTERPVYRSLKIYQRKPTVEREIKKIEIGGNESFTLNADARAFSFKSFGNGSCKIKDTLGERSFDLSDESNVHMGFLYGESEIEFSSDHGCTVYDLWLLNGITGNKAGDIPQMCEHREYKLSDIRKDFRSIAYLPEDCNGKRIYGASILGDTLMIPYSFEGEIRLVYSILPSMPSGNADEIISTPNGCEHLLPLLIAAYVWLDDDGDKAQYYMNLYREAISAVKVYSRSSINSSYDDITGWA